MANDLSFSADSEELTDLCFITVCTLFLVANIDLPSKHLVKESHDNMLHHYDTTLTALVLAFVHTELVPGLNPGMLLGPQSGIDPGINAIRQFSGTNVQCERGLCVCRFCLIPKGYNTHQFLFFAELYNQILSL